ncbi:MAG: metallophosphoesterase, partial [Myxococcota bacterium]
RALVVGDVHGCLEELLELIDRAHLNDSETLALVGDLCNKGPDSAGVVRFARKRAALVVRGNHDERLVRAWRKGGGGKHALDAFAEDDVAYLEGLPLTGTLAQRPLWRGRTRSVRLVHAALRAQGPTPAALMMNGRSLKEGELSASHEGEPWGASWPGPELVIFGHDAVRGRQEHEHAIGLDTGCCYGGALTGVILESGKPVEWVSVPAKKAYAPVR